MRIPALENSFEVRARQAPDGGSSTAGSGGRRRGVTGRQRASRKTKEGRPLAVLRDLRRERYVDLLLSSAQAIDVQPDTTFLLPPTCNPSSPIQPSPPTQLASMSVAPTPSCRSSWAEQAPNVSLSSTPVPESSPASSRLPILKANGLKGVITFIEGKLLIISECLDYALLYDSILGSVRVAHHRFPAPTGVVAQAPIMLALANPAETRMEHVDS
uniref:LSM domain-containing protein n=1 Tax=Mycena chlorophos TaxID=658473 RepID=A0ABQ0L1Y7_MYCCL|nr:predicted protein [Mycena chlorophos]